MNAHRVQMYDAPLGTYDMFPRAQQCTMYEVWRFTSFFHIELISNCWTHYSRVLVFNFIRVSSCENSKCHVCMTCDEHSFMIRVRRASADTSSAAIVTRAVSSSMRGRTWHIYMQHVLLSTRHQFHFLPVYIYLFLVIVPADTRGNFCFFRNEIVYFYIS